jgi:hypothetical protein
LKPHCPHLELVDTHAHPDPDSGAINPELLKPDISIYNSKTSRERETDFSLIEAHIEVKFDTDDDAFCDDNAVSVERTSQRGQDTKGQIASYAVAQLATQFRKYIFSILVVGDHARILRWDRSGAIVTKAFKYSGRHLADFFWRYDRALPADRGVDESVSEPSSDEIELARRHLRLSIQDRLVKFAVHSDVDNTISYYVGSRPTFKGNSSPTGRATRTFIVLELQTLNVVFFKDTWRIDLPGVQREGMLYARLHKSNVLHIPPFLRGGDVPGQSTRTQEFVDAEWARPLLKPLRPHQHYRLVLGVVARDLTSFESSYELVVAMKDAIQGTTIFVISKLPTHMVVL